jgi:hypothetical protein
VKSATAREHGAAILTRSVSSCRIRRGRMRCGIDSASWPNPSTHFTAAKLRAGPHTCHFLQVQA